MLKMSSAIIYMLISLLLNDKTSIFAHKKMKIKYADS